MRLRFLWVGKTRDPHWVGLEERYLERLRRFFSTERTTVRDLKKTDPRQYKARIRKEAESIEEKFLRADYRVVLDQEGKQYNSQQFASLLEKSMNQGISELAFLAGGCHGIPDQIKDLGHLRLSLSKLTMPHELARILLLEQVYRALTILRGWPYHK